MPWMNAAVECQACGYRFQTVVELYEDGSFPPAVEEGTLECPVCHQLAGSVPTIDEYKHWDGYGFSRTKA